MSNENNELIEQYKNAVRNGRIFNGGTQCDTWDGPCACGAWHKPREAATRLQKVERPRLRIVR